MKSSFPLQQEPKSDAINLDEQEVIHFSFNFLIPRKKTKKI